MNKIYKVLSNLNHNGTSHAKGEYIDGEFAGSEALVLDGVLKLIEGATTIEEAKEIEAEASEQEAPAEEEVAPQDTWGPTKDEEQLDKDIDNLVNDTKLEDEVYTGPMEFYKVVGEVHPLNEDGSPKDEVLEVGSIHELPKGAVDVESGLWEVATPEEVNGIKTPEVESGEKIDDTIL